MRSAPKLLDPFRSERQDGPNACGLCGIDERPHGLQYTKADGWHEWSPPTQGQIKARMRARGNAKRMMEKVDE